MKRLIFLMALITLAADSSGIAQPPKAADWIGIWNADLNGQPTGTLTLADDTGRLGGTVVLDMVSREGGTPHVIVSDAHVLIGPHVDGNTLTFQVKIKRPDGSISLADFAVIYLSADQASIHCTNCGSNAPVVGLVKGH
jgi:hypothetical protein